MVSTLPTATTAQSWRARHQVATVAVLFAATTLALMPVDAEVTEEFREPARQRNTVLQHGASTFNFLGGPGAVIASVATLGVGAIRHDTAWTRVGVRATEALVFSGTATALLKGAFGRQRPFVNETDSRAWYPGRGFSGGGRTSFPSGHATSAFAVATVVSRELHVRAPRVARVATPLLYGSAVLVAAARIYGAHHWASDVVAGAGVGTFTGYLVTRHNAGIGAQGVHIEF